jgi:hypothetical protein
MKNKILLMIGLVFSIYLSCNAQRVLSKEQQEKYYPSKKRKFKLSKQVFELSDTAIVATNAVYVRSVPAAPWEKSNDSTYSYFRFFIDGSMFISFTYRNYPSVEEFNDLSYGQYGRYVIEEGKVKMEMLIDKQAGMMFLYAKPDEKGLTIYLATGRGKGLFNKKSKTYSFYQCK